MKPREENSIRWVELLDKFKSVQERSRRSQRGSRNPDEDANGIRNSSLAAALSAAVSASATTPVDQARQKGRTLPDAPRGGVGVGSGGVSGSGRRSTSPDSSAQRGSTSSGHKHKSGLGNLGRLGIGGRKSKR